MAGRKPTGRPPGPVPIEIDWDRVDRLLEAGCHGTEVAAYFGIHEDTFYKRVEQEKLMGFSAYSRQKKCRGDSLLRAKQTEVAMKGDKTMLVWLGKQRLGQKENTDNKEYDPQLLEAFKSFMQAMGLAQTARTNANKSINTDSKSECVTGDSLAP